MLTAATSRAGDPRSHDSPHVQIPGCRAGCCRPGDGAASRRRSRPGAARASARRSANTGNSITAGIVDLSSSSEDEALLTVTALAPGHSSSATVDVANTGDLPAAFELTRALVDTPASPALSAKADLKIVDLGDPACSASCPAASTVFDGKLGSVVTVALGTWQPGDTHRFRFTVSLADGGTGAENAYQGAQPRSTSAGRPPVLGAA